jgi:hypothetical protein
MASVSLFAVRVSLEVCVSAAAADAAVAQGERGNFVREGEGDVVATCMGAYMRTARAAKCNVGFIPAACACRF